MGICILFTIGAWYFTSKADVEEKVVYGSTPFLQVTNRQYSLFLWQNPEFMRQKMKRKRDYLEAWGDNLTVDPVDADKWVQAPSEGLFLYHTWYRLVGDYYYPRPIQQKEFAAFLKADPQWHPRYWKNAPAQYKTVVQWIEEGSQMGNLNELNSLEMPLSVKQAFQGWKNFTKESEKIAQVSLSERQLALFIDRYPNFRRPFWINLVRETAPNYLKNIDPTSKELVAKDKLDGLLQLALYNFLTGFKNQ